MIFLTRRDLPDMTPVIRQTALARGSTTELGFTKMGELLPGHGM
jgi:hypothetical protein